MDESDNYDIGGGIGITSSTLASHFYPGVFTMKV